MKKNLFKSILATVIIIVTVCTSGCTGEYLVRNTTKKVVSAFLNNDKDAVKKIFSENVLKEYKTFDEDLEKAFSYFNKIGSQKYTYSYDGGNSTKENGNRVAFESYLAETNIGQFTYYIWVDMCVDDETDEKNEGIWDISMGKYKNSDDDDYINDTEDEIDEDSDTDYDDDVYPQYGIFIDE